MKIFLIKTMIFVLILLALSNILQFFAPYYWGNPGYSAKSRYLYGTDTLEEFNTFFFGSSRIYRHIDPLIFDGLSTPTVKSFNMGYASTFVPETYYLLENFIKNTNYVENGFIIVELQAINSMPDKNLHTTRTKYYLVSNEYLFAITAILENKNITGFKKSKSIWNYTISYLEKLSGIGILFDLFNYLLYPTITGDIGLYNRGHYSLNTQLLSRPSKGLIKRNNNFLKNPAIILDKSKTEAQIAYRKNQFADYNTVHLNRIEKLISMSEEKGFYLIFVLPPRLKGGYIELLPLFENIDNRHKIDLGNPDRFPEFYSVANSFDMDHFNDAGVKLYTLELTAEFNELLRRDPTYSLYLNLD